MKIIYSNTRACFHDTLAIAKGKWLQQKNTPNNAYNGKTAEPTSTLPRLTDGKVMTVQKILTSLHQ